MHDISQNERYEAAIDQLRILKTEGYFSTLFIIADNFENILCLHSTGNPPEAIGLIQIQLTKLINSFASQEIVKND